MTPRKTYLFIALGITLTVLALLVTGSSLLTIALDDANTIPLGTFITWVGLIALPLSIYWGIKELRKPSTSFNRALSALLKLVIMLAILWMPLSYLLAGNLSFSFAERASFQGGQTAMRLFWYLSYGLGIGAISILPLYWISLLFVEKRK